MTMFTKGAGNRLQDSNGNWWLDFRSGIMNVTLGHGHHVVMDALEEVVACGLVNSYYNYSTNLHMLEAELGRFSPNYRWRVMSTGAETIDRAVQVAAVRLGRMPRIAAVRGGFHGKMMPYTVMRHPDAPWGNPFDIITFDVYDQNVPDFDVLLYEPLMNLTSQRVDEHWLRELCNERDALMVADEMITGFYRCGKRLLSEQADIVVSGKGLAQGVPIAVIGLRHGLHTVDIPPAWSTTASGNNLCATVALRVVQHLLRHEEGVKQASQQNQERLESLGFTATGSLGFMAHPDPDGLQDALHRHRVLATIREDGLLRVGPCLGNSDKDFEQVKQALEDV